MAESNIQKATIVNINDTSQYVTCQFNPEEYSLKKQNSWKEKPVKGMEVPELEFSGGKPATLKMKLFFDTTATGEDVRQTYTDKLWDMMKLSTTNQATGKGEPPKCQFQWGSNLYFTAVIKDINQKFTMFLRDGTPVRAKLDVTFQQVEDDNHYPPQNPTSVSVARRTRVIGPGDRLDLIAYDEYGDPNRWYDLAKANDLSNPMALQIGQILQIPD
jgi:hypothetical protein